MKISEYNDMMAYLTRPPRSEQQEASGERVQLAAGTSLKYMIDFILRNARKVTKKVPSKQFLEKMAEANPQNIVNAYEDVKKRAGIIDDPDVLIGQAPKTDLEKIRAKAKKDKESIQQLADDNQIPVKDETIVPEDVITVPEPFKEKYQQEFLAHDALYGRRSGDNKVDAEAIAETVADMQGKVYDDLGYKERIDLYDKAYGYLSLLDRTKSAMKEAKGRTLQAEGGVIGGGIVEGEDLGDRTGFKEPKTSIRRGVVEDYSKPGSSIPAIRQIKKGENEGKWAYRKSGKITGYYDSEKEAKEAQRKAIEAQYEGAKKPFSEKEIREVKKLRSEGKTIEQIAKESGIDSRQRVVNILRSEGLTSKRGGSSKYLEDEDNLKYVQENYKKLKRSTIGENLFPDVSPSVAYDRAGRLISKLSKEGKIDTSGTRFSKEYIEEAGLQKIPKDEQSRIKGKKRYAREKAVGGKNYKDHLLKYKKEIGEVLKIPKVERKTSALTSSDFIPMDMAHRSDMDFLKLLKDSIRAEDFGVDYAKTNRTKVKTLENKLKPLYFDQSKLYKKAKKLDKIPKELRSKIETNNLKIQETFRDFPEISNRIKPITIDPINLNIYRGSKDVTKQLGIGIVDEAMENIKIGSEEDIIIKANLAEQIKNEALQEGLIKNKNLADKRLGKFFKREVIEDINIPTEDILKSVANKAAANPIVDMFRVAAPSLPAVFGPTGIAGLTYALRPEEGYDLSDPLTRIGFEAEAALAPTAVKGTSKAASYLAGGNQTLRRGLERVVNLGMRAPTALKIARFASPVGIATLGAEGAYQLYQALENEKARIAAMSPEERQRFEEEQTAAAYMGEAEGYAYGGRVELEEGGPPDPGRRKFFKIMGGLASLPILGKIAKPIAKAGPEAVEVISRTAEQMPTYLTTLINKIKNFGKSKVLGKPDSPDGAMEYNLGDYTVIEGPGYTRVNKSNYGGFGDEVGIRNEIEMEIKKDPETGVIQYEEIEVYPDMDGKMRDVEEGVDDMFHEEMEKFARSDD